MAKQEHFKLVEDWKNNKWGWAGFAIVVICSAAPSILEVIPAEAGTAAAITAGIITVAGMAGRALVMLGVLKVENGKKKKNDDKEDE